MRYNTLQYLDQGNMPNTYARVLERLRGTGQQNVTPALERRSFRKGPQSQQLRPSEKGNKKVMLALIY